MPIRPIKIMDASPEQRVDYVRTFLNLPLTGAESESEVLAKIDQAQPGQGMMFVNEPDTPQDMAAAETVGEVPLKPEESTGKMTGTLGKGDPRAVIFIPPVETEDGSGTRDVLVGVNGRAWQLKRGVDLPLPWRVVEALQNAVADTVRHRDDEGHEGEVVVTPTHRINFNFVEKPPQHEIIEWRERTGADFCA